MGCVAVLHPQDRLKKPLLSNEPLILSRHTKKPPRNPNPSSNVNRTNRRKRGPTGTGGAIQSRSSPAQSMVTKVPTAKDLVMGQVKILKRGEVLTQTTTSYRASDVEKIDDDNNKYCVDDLGLQLTDRLGPDPSMVSKQIGVIGDLYAGSAFITSPPPSSVPLPGFFAKNGVFANNNVAKSVLLSMVRLNLA